MVTGVFFEMKIANLTLHEIRKRGLEALQKALGPADMIRFLNDLQSGSGDYTKERHKWLDQYDVQKIVNEIKK